MFNLRCNFLATTGDGQELCGYLLLEGKKIKVRPSSRYKILFQNVMDGSNDAEEKKMLKDDPVSWMRNLPKKYSGSYLRAQIVE
jgi:hypothetical protein